MVTYTFIGSDKNAGKTTAMNYVFRDCLRAGKNPREICLTSIGINGERVDSYDSRAKPKINVRRHTLFVTTGEHLNGLSGSYEVIDCLSSPEFPKTYVFARAATNLTLVLEGPNEKAGIQIIKEMLESDSKNTICLIDGAIDRLFIGHPSISDGIILSLLVSDDPGQQSMLDELLSAIMLPEIDPITRDSIIERMGINDKSLLLNKQGETIYQGDTVPFLDETLKEKILSSRKEQMTLYLDGGLSRSLREFLAPFEQLTVVLNSFTACQRFSTESNILKAFRPQLSVYHSVPIVCIFLKQETDRFRLKLPPRIPVFNLYRDIPHEAVI